METLIIEYKDGIEINRVDTRTVAGQKLLRIAEIKRVAGEAILAAYPVYKQQNAALGLLTPEETQAVKDGIQAIRDDVASAEAAINACETLVELDAL